MWKTSRAPYQKGIMDAVNDPKINTIVFMKSAQVGATEILNNIVAYYIESLIIFSTSLKSSLAKTK